MLNPQMDKQAFHRHAKKYFKVLAVNAGIAAADYDLRTNLGGPAVLGETTLHSDSVYVQTTESMGIMVRSCRGRKDYTGGRNHFVKYGDFDGLISLVKKLSSQYI